VTLTALTEIFRVFSDYRMLIYGALLIFTMLFRKEGIFGEKEYSLKIAWPPVREKAYAVGDRFIDTGNEKENASS
jgi:hypothetical protein